MSIFLIQATDLPYEDSAKLLQETPLSNHQPLLAKEVANPEEINALASTENGAKSDYEKLLETELLKPLLKLYQQEKVSNRTTFDADKRISKEDRLEDLRSLSKDELELLSSNRDVYQNPEPEQIQDENKRKITRRDDLFVTDNQDEHIGEILPNEYHNQYETLNRRNDHFRSPMRIRVQNYRKLYDFEDKPHQVSYALGELYRKSKQHPSVYHRPEYEEGLAETTGYAEEELDETGKSFVRPIKFNFPPNDGALSFRNPRTRQRGHRDVFKDGRESRFEQSISWNAARRPRVIFPSDLVAFREPGQDNEPDYLAGDSNLQDLQQPDLRDRG